MHHTIIIINIKIKVIYEERADSAANYQLKQRRSDRFARIFFVLDSNSNDVTMLNAADIQASCGVLVPIMVKNRAHCSIHY